MHGGVAKTELSGENLEALKLGMPNLLKHISNIKDVYKLPCVVAVNKFPTDTDAEVNLVIDECKKLGINTVLSDVWAKGGAGGEELAKEIVRLCEEENNFEFAYGLDGTIEEKIEAIVKRIYGGNGISVDKKAKKQIDKITEMGYSDLPICMAKTQYSFSDDMAKLGAPKDFTVNIKNVKINAGAGFIVVLTGDIMTMPGLPKSPAAERIDVDENGVISGLF